MSTVGFGDLYPISDKERIFLIFLLFSGVILFAQIQGHYQQTFDEIQNFFQDFDDCDNLESFFELIKERYNKDKDINPELKARIERYFHHKWKHDRNNAIRIPQVQYIIMNLPQEVSSKIMTDFLFHKFVHIFSKMFQIRKWKSMH